MSSLSLGVVSIGFGLMPLLALALYLFRRGILAQAAYVWAFLAGGLAFIGLGHASSAVLEANAYLKYAATPWISAGTAALGFLLGVGLFAGMLRVSGHREGWASQWILAGVAVYIALHSFADGYVLGQAYVGIGAPGYEVDLVTLGGTLSHRLVEGALIVVPAVELAWKPMRTGVLLLVGLLNVPAAYLGPAIFQAPISASIATDWYYAITVFAGAAELGFALPLLLLGVVPRLEAARSRAWLVSLAALGFGAMLFVHFLVE